MITPSFIQRVKKYAIVIFVFSFLHVILIFSLPALIAVVGDSSTYSQGLMQAASWIPSYLLNIIAAILVYQDMKKSQNVSVSVILVTIVVGEYGVVLFLLTELYKIAMMREPIGHEKLS